MSLIVISTSQDKVMHTMIQNNIYVNSFGIALSLSHCIYPLTCFSLSFFSLTYQEFITVTEEVQAWETEGLHGRQWARHFMTKYQPHRTWHPLKQHTPTRDFSFTKALVLGIQGSACQQRHPNTSESCPVVEFNTLNIKNREIIVDTSLLCVTSVS